VKTNFNLADGVRVAKDCRPARFQPIAADIDNDIPIEKGLGSRRAALTAGL